MQTKAMEQNIPPLMIKLIALTILFAIGALVLYKSTTTLFVILIICLPLSFLHACAIFFNNPDVKKLEHGDLRERMEELKRRDLIEGLGRQFSHLIAESFTKIFLMGSIMMSAGIGVSTSTGKLWIGIVASVISTILMLIVALEIFDPKLKNKKPLIILLGAVLIELIVITSIETMRLLGMYS